MKKFNLIAGKPAAAIAVALLAAASLAACGSGTETHTYPDPGTPAPTPVPMIDAFFAAVSGIVSASSDTTEVNTIDAITATLPENTEPEPLG